APRPDAAKEHDALRRGLDGRPLQKLRSWDLDRFYGQLLAAGGRGGRPLAPSTVRKVHTVLRLALEQAVRWRWIAENPAIHASPPTAPRSSPKPPAAADARTLIQTADADDPEWGA